MCRHLLVHTLSPVVFRQVQVQVQVVWRGGVPQVAPRPMPRAPAHAHARAPAHTHAHAPRVAGRSANDT